MKTQAFLDGPQVKNGNNLELSPWYWSCGIVWLLNGGSVDFDSLQSLCMHVCSVVSDSITPWTVAH